MTSQFSGEIIIFPFTNMPDKCRTAVIVKGSINKSGSSSFIFLVSMSTSTHSSTRLHQQQHIKVFLIYHIFNKKNNTNLVHVFTFIKVSAIFNVDFDFA